MSKVLIPYLRNLTSKIHKSLIPGISQPRATVESLQTAVEELKIGHEMLTRGRGNKADSALLVHEFDKAIAVLVRVLDTRYVSSATEVDPGLGLPPVDDISSIYVPAGYGGLYLAAPDVTFPSLSTGWRTVRMDTDAVANPRGVLQLPEENAVRLEVEGIWNLSAQVSFFHDSSNSGRITYARFYNVTDDLPGQAFPIGIGRNVEASSFTLPLLIETPELGVTGAKYRLQLGGGDDVVIDMLASASVSLTYASEFRG